MATFVVLSGESIMLKIKVITLLFIISSLVLFRLVALPHIVLIGSPGAGKGTMCQMLTQTHVDYVHVGVGDMLRREIRKESEVGRYIKSVFDAGTLVPDRVLNEMISNALTVILSQGKKFILEGFPENLVQLKFLEKFLLDSNINDVCFINLVVYPAIAITRIITRKTCSACSATYNTKTNQCVNENLCDRCGSTLLKRPDDNEVSAQHRVTSYTEERYNVIDFYLKHKKLIMVDATKDMAIVFKDFENSIKTAEI